jgi:hypothetical protein
MTKGTCICSERDTAMANGVGVSEDAIRGFIEILGEQNALLEHAVTIIEL